MDVRFRGENVNRMRRKYNYTIMKQFGKNKEMVCIFCNKPYRWKPLKCENKEHFEYFLKWYKYRKSLSLRYVEWKKNHNRERKLIVLKHYANPLECACCKEKRLEFLTIHHPKNDGKNDRQTRGFGSHFYSSLIKDNFPSGYEVLCWNCNCAKRYGECPHKQIKQSIILERRKEDIVI